MPKTRRDVRRTGIWPLSYLGVEPVAPPLLLTDNRAPTTQDYKNFNVGTLWVDRSTAPNEDIWMLVNKDNNVARWLRISVVTAPLETLTGNVGGAVGPDALDNIDILGSGPFIFTGNPATWTLTLSHDGTLATQYDGNTGSATPAAGILQILGGTNATTVAGGNTVTINVDGTVASSYVTNAGTATPAAGVLNVLGGELIGTTGAGNTVTANLDRGTDGQLIIAATGAASAYANLTSSGGTINITEGANTLNIDVSSVPPSNLGYTNIGMTVDTGASTITIHSADGTAFSASNVGTVTFASKATPGIFVTCNVTSNVSMDWSNMDGNTMGTEGSKAWADQLPLYVYAVLNDAENDCTFGLARMPHHAASGITANIGTPATPNADEDISLFLFESVTITDYDDNPVVVLGSVKATKNASDQWTFIALKGGSTGIGGFVLGTVFSMPPLQNGAVNNHVFTVGASTVPTFVGSHMYYGITPDGTIIIDLALNGVSVIGVGGNTLYVSAPLNGTLIRNAGTFNVASQSVSVVAKQGTYRGLYIDGKQPNGFFGIEFVKIENVRLYPVDFDTVTGAASQLAGSIGYTLQNNQLP